MESYDYAAYDETGTRLTGTIPANNPREARDILRSRRLKPIELKAAKSKQKSSLSFAKKASHKDITQATRQLAILIDAATPVEEAIKVVALQFENSPMRQILLDVRSQVMEGARLSDALRAHPRTFTDLFASMVASGETSGRLAEVLDRLALDLEGSQAIRRKILAATIYPMVLSVVAITVVIVLMIFVVPRVVEQFESFGQDLPWLTEAVIRLSDWLKKYGIILALLLAAGGFAFSRALKRPKIKYRWHDFLLDIPLIGRLIRDMNAARFARTMAGLIDSGTPALTAMETSKHTLRNVVMRDAVSRAAVKVREGMSVSAALRQSNVFPPLVTQMVAGGEASGDIGKMFGKSADYLEGEFDSTTSVFLNLLEPLIIILMSVVVLVIIAAIFLPILRLNTMAF